MSAAGTHGDGPARVVLASGNPGKLREIAAMAERHRVELIAQSAFDVPEVEESGLTFVENAILKARQAAGHTGLPAIADDSGLAVDALGGEPGIHSARYAGLEAGDAERVEKLLAALEHVPDAARTAHFHCAMVYLRHARDPAPMIGEGLWHGRVLRAPRGTGGFGYDPVFWVPDRECSAAELAPADKNRLSHRARALTALWRRLDGLDDA